MQILLYRIYALPTDALEAVMIKSGAQSHGSRNILCIMLIVAKKYKLIGLTNTAVKFSLVLAQKLIYIRVLPLHSPKVTNPNE